MSGLPFATVLTIHHLAEQGSFWGLEFGLTNLPERFFTLHGVEFFGRTFTPRELAERIYEALNEQVGSPGDALHALESALSLTMSGSFVAGF